MVTLTSVLDGAVEFRVLGPVEVWVRGQQVAPSAPKPRTLLAALVLDSNRPVPAERLIDVVWGQCAPRTAANTLQVYLSRLRGVLATARATDVTLEARPPCYTLRADPRRIDVCRFRQLVAAARAESADPDHAGALYQEALGLWRGPALAGVASDRLRTTTVAGLEEEQLTATEEWLALQIAQGRHHEAASLLHPLVAAHPYRERLRELLMRAMEGSGRRADALAAFRAARATFNADLGIEPGVRLAALHQRILTGQEVSKEVGEEVGQAAGAAGAAGRAGRPGAPRSGRPERDDLPRDLPDMTGRADEVSYLLGRIAPAPTIDGTAGVVAIDGMAGVGKTTLAVHVAHRVAERFSVRLFLDLRGHTAGEQPMEPVTALGVLLRALGVPDARVPEDPPARAALWRAEVAHRRVLLVLDNAASTAQIEPLLPGSARCLAFVTSRNRLVGLESAANLSLDVLPVAEAVALLRAVVADRRIEAGADVAEIVRLCGRLPLAIRVAGARLRHRPAWSAAYLASRLRQGQRRLTELTVDGRSVVAAFDVSYDNLGEPQRRLFRLIGLAPGEDLDRYQAAVLAATDGQVAEAMLEELVDANLLTEPVAGRYAMHDLLREYARSRARAEEPLAAEYLERLLSAVVRAAREAAHLVEPLESSAEPPATGQPRAAAPFACRADALRWLAVERRNLVAAVRFAAATGQARHAWRLAEALWHFCFLRGYTDDWIETHTVALAAAKEAGDRRGEAAMAMNLGYAYRRKGRIDEALVHLRRALAIYRQTGDRRRAATAHGKVGTVYELRGMDRAAAAHHRRALTIRRQLGDRRGEGNTLNNLGALLVRAGRHDLAIAYFEAAVAVFRNVGDPTGEGRALSNIGQAYTLAGRLDDAQRCLEAALALRRATGDRRGEANTLDNLGSLYCGLGRVRDAVEHLQRALAMMRECGDAQGECETRIDLGHALHRAGRSAEAAAQFRAALAMAEAGNMRYERDRAADGLGRLTGPA